MSKVLILDTNYARVRDDIAKIFEEFDFDFYGKRVFLKPNILAAFPPERGVTTHPKVIEATVGYLMERGAQVVVGDNSGMRIAYGNNESVAKVTGIYGSSLGRYRNIACSGIRVKTKFKDYPEITISKEVFDCDIFISMPKFKTHLNTIISGAVKNSYGLVVGAEKMRLHALFPDFERFAEVVIEVFKMRPPDLIIMDAVLGMEGDGPNSPSLREINRIIASHDAVAIDAVMCFMMGIDPERVNTLKIAKKEAMGETDVHKLDIKGRLEKIPDFKSPFTYRNNARRDSVINFLLAKFVSASRLKVAQKKCIKCKRCYDNCPAGAILTNNKHLRIDTTKCILCFCCKEICPNDAITIKGLFGMVQKVFK